MSVNSNYQQLYILVFIYLYVRPVEQNMCFNFGKRLNR